MVVTWFQVSSVAYRFNPRTSLIRNTFWEMFWFSSIETPWQLSLDGLLSNLVGSQEKEFVWKLIVKCQLYSNLKQYAMKGILTPQS